MKKSIVGMLVCLLLSACATAPQKADLPVRWGTIVDAHPSYRTGTKTSGGATAGGAVLGGLLGNQVGAGTGKKAATVTGAILGAAVANKASEREVMIPATAVIIRDDQSKEEYQVMLDGSQWRRGMKIRFSVSQAENGEYQVMIR